MDLEIITSTFERWFSGQQMTTNDTTLIFLCFLSCVMLIFITVLLVFISIRTLFWNRIGWAMEDLWHWVKRNIRSDVTFVLLLLSHFAGMAQAKGDLLWPIKGQEAGTNVLLRPQDLLDHEANFSTLVIGAPEGTEVIAPADGEVSGIMLTYCPGLFSCNTYGYDSEKTADGLRRQLEADTSVRDPKKYINGNITLKLADGRRIDFYGLRGDIPFRSGERVKAGTLLGTVSYVYQKIGQPHGAPPSPCPSEQGKCRLDPFPFSGHLLIFLSARLVPAALSQRSEDPVGRPPAAGEPGVQDGVPASQQYRAETVLTLPCQLFLYPGRPRRSCSFRAGGSRYGTQRLVEFAVLHDYPLVLDHEGQHPQGIPHLFGIGLGLQDQGTETPCLERLPQEDPAHEPATHPGDHQDLRLTGCVGVQTVRKTQCDMFPLLLRGKKSQIVSCLLQRSRDHIHGQGPADPPLFQQIERDVGVVTAHVAEALPRGHQVGDGLQPGGQEDFSAARQSR